MRRREMERKRTIQKQREFYNRTYKDIESSKRKKANARLKDGLYKQLFEEFVILLEYCELKYPDDPSIKFRWLGKEKQGTTLNYDGEIFRNNQCIERIEITCPLNSEKDHFIAVQLNKKGYTDIEIGNLDDALSTNRNKIKEKTIKKTNKKTYDSTVTLLVYYEDFATSFDIKETKNSINNIINDLKNNNYVFKNVYLLLNMNNKKQLITIK